MTLEVGKKYTDGSSIVEIKFIDYESCAWGLDQRLRPRFIATSNVYSWQEVSDKPDPGEGWRLLEPHEDVEEGDEWFFVSCKLWTIVINNTGKQTKDVTYRRRTTPQYVPYTWDDREELRGRWYRRKDNKDYERQVTLFDGGINNMFINGWEAKDFLRECEWIDGSPCGKRVV